MLKMTSPIAVTLWLTLLTSDAAARSYTLDAPLVLDVAYTEAIPVEIHVGPEAPDAVLAELAGFVAELEPLGGGVYAGAIALEPVPLPPGTYTVIYTAFDEHGAESAFNQRLIIAPPDDGAAPWLPGQRPTGGPLVIEPLGGQTWPADQCCGVSVRIDGGRPARFEAILAGYRANLVNQGDYRYQGGFDRGVILPPATYTVRVEADGLDGAQTVVEWALTITPPEDGSTPWLVPVAPTVWEASPLDYGRSIGGEPEAGCAGGGGPGGSWLLALAAIVWVLRRRAARWLPIALGSLLAAGCAGETETRKVGRGEALVQIVDEGDGVTNEAPLWPLALGHRIPLGGAELAVTESWPLDHGGRGMIVRVLDAGHGWHEVAATPDGLYVVASSAGGRLHRPLLFLPTAVRVGMTWRTWARPADVARLDLHPAELVDASGGYELRVVRVTEHHDALTPLARGRVWDIEWKGPVPPHSTFEWIQEAQGVENPRSPSRGRMQFLEGVGPTNYGAFPAVAHAAYNRDGIDQMGVIGATGVRIIPAPPVDEASAPQVSLSAVPRPEAFDRTSIHQIGLIDLDDGHGPWLRFDGNAAGLGYPSAFPGFGGGGGNANLWVAAAGSGCFTLDGGRLVSGQELGVLAEDETCVHAAGTLVSASGDAAWDVPFLDYFGRPVPEAVLEGCDDHPGCHISTWPRAVLPGEGGGALFLAQHKGAQPWRLYPWRAFEWSQRHDLNDLEPVGDVDGAALTELFGAVGVNQLVARPLGDGSFGLLARSAVRYGDPTDFGFARLDPDGVVRDPIAFGPVGFGTSFRTDATGPEIWQVDRGGRVWEWRFTPTGMERRVRARLKLAADETPTAAVRLDDARLFVVTAGPQPDNVPPLTARLECTKSHCWERPDPAPPKLWTAPLPPAGDASPWEPPPAILTVAVSEDGRTACGAYGEDGSTGLVGTGTGLAEDAEGRCVSVDVDGAAAAPIWEYTAQLPGTAPFRVVPMDAPFAAGAE